MSVIAQDSAAHIETHRNHVRALGMIQSVGFDTNPLDCFGFPVDEWLDIPTATYAEGNEAIDALTTISFFHNIEVTETHHFYDCDSARWHEREMNADIQSMLTTVLDSRDNPERFSCAYVAMREHGARTADNSYPMVFIVELGDGGEPSTHVFTLQVVASK